METKIKAILDEETIQRINEALDKKPIGQDKLARAKKLVEKDILTLENIEKAAQKAKLEKE